MIVETLQNNPFLPASSAENAFWQIVSADQELQQIAQALKQRGQFTNSGTSVRFTFPWNGQHRQFDSQIGANTNVVQVRRFLTTCRKGVDGIVEQPHYRPFQWVSRRSL